MPTDLPELADLLPSSDVIDIKTATGAPPLREFIAGALDHQPLWMKAMYAVRMLFAKALRLRMAGMPPTGAIHPEDVSFTHGSLSFFKVIRGEEHHYLLLGIKDNHLTAYVAFIVADDAAPIRDYKVVTLVTFHRKAGTLYWRVISIFHHLVIKSMIRAGLRGNTPHHEEHRIA